MERGTAKERKRSDWEEVQTAKNEQKDKPALLSSKQEWNKNNVRSRGIMIKYHKVRKVNWLWWNGLDNLHLSLYNKK